MKLLALPPLLAALIALPHSALQDDDRDALIKRMADVHGATGALEWRAHTWYGGRDYADRGNYAVGRWVRGVGMRFDVTIVTCSEPVEHRPEQAPNRFAIAWTPDAVTVGTGFVLLEERTGKAPPAMVVRAKKGDSVLEAVDPVFVFPPLPVLFVMNAPSLAFALDPELMLAYEPGLKLAGREKFGDRECARLVSTRKLGRLEPTIHPLWYRVLTQEKSIYVDVETARVAGIVYKQVLRREHGDVPVTVTSRVVKRNDAGLPTEIVSTVDEEGMAGSLPPFLQRLEYAAAPPARGSIAMWDAPPDGPAGPLTLLDAPAPAAGAARDLALAAHVARANHRAMRLVGGAPAFESPEQERELLDAWRAIGTADGGGALANLHWYGRVRRSAELCREALRAALDSPTLSPIAAGYFSRVCVYEQKPENALALTERAPATADPYLRQQRSIDRMTALLSLKRVDDLAKEFRDGLAACGSFAEKLHFLRHVEEMGDRIRLAVKPQAALLEAAAAKLDAGDPANAVAQAMVHAWAGRPGDERAAYERLLDAAPDDEQRRHLYLRCAWRQLATPHDPALPVRLNHKLGPPGDARRFDAAVEPSQVEAARAFAARLSKLAETKGDDPRVPYLAGLAHLRAGEPDRAWPFYARAVEMSGSVPQDPIRLVAAGAVYSEIAQAAAARRRLDLLEQVARAWYDASVRCGWPDAELQRDETRNPVWLCALTMLELKQYARCFRLTAFSDPHHVGAGESLRARIHERAVAPGEVAAAIAAELGPNAAAGDFVVARKWLHANFPMTAELLASAADVLDRCAKPTVELHRHRARARVALQQWDRAFEAASAALAAEPDDEMLALYAARLTVLRGKPEEGRAILAALAGARKVRRLQHFGAVCEELGDFDGAKTWFESALAAGQEPFNALGRLYFRAGRWDEAMRFFNRTLAGRGQMIGWPDEEALPIPPVVEGFPSNPAEGRTRILEKLGENHYIDKLMKEPLELKADEEKRVAALVAQLQGEDMAARTKAMEQLRACDRGAAKLVHPLLSHADAWVAYAAREILGGWAEPR